MELNGRPFSAARRAWHVRFAHFWQAPIPTITMWAIRTNIVFRDNRLEHGLHTTNHLEMMIVGALTFTHSGAVIDAEEQLQVEKKTFVDANERQLPYRLLKPDAYDARFDYPLVLFLHGAGERGDDNEAQLKHGVPEFASTENRAKYPCFLLAPQCPVDERWSDWSTEKQAAQPSWPLQSCVVLVRQLQKDYAIDRQRTYVTGLSMGGFGAWDLIRRFPKLFAAAVPVCGGGDPDAAAALATVPIWAFHGARDRAVPVRFSRNMMAAIKKAGGQPRYTEYANVGHESWVPAYRDAEMFAWLFAQRGT